MLFYGCNDFLKDFGLVLGQTGEAFPVEAHIRFLERTDELAVAHALFYCSSANFYVPEAAVVAFLFLTALKSVRPGVQECLFGGALLALAPPLEALGVLENLFSFFDGQHAALNSSHNLVG